MTNDYGNLELHKVLLSAMKDIDHICRQNGLKYYLHAGTLLGALNHKGFIPWDDDVDISLLRSDYEKLIQILQDQYKDTYFVHNYKSDDFYSNNRSVLRILGTKVYHNISNKEAHNEIGIDIVPLDNVPNTKIARKLQQGIILCLDCAVQIKQGVIIPRSIGTKILCILSKLDRGFLGKMIDRVCMLSKNSNSKYIGLLSYTGKNPYTGRSGYENDLMLREWYKNPVYVSFENTQFMTISAPEEELKRRYGPNWYEPYPEEKRVTKHNVCSYWISDEVRKRVGL